MKSYTKNQLQRLRIALILNSDKRVKYILKHHIFKSVGEHFFFDKEILLDLNDLNLNEKHHA